MQNLKVILLQTEQFWEEKQENLKHFEKKLSAISGSPDLIVLPEMFHTGFSMNSSKLAETMDGLGMQWLKEQASKYQAAIVASLIIKENERYFNRMVFVEPNGDVQHYDKRKLFGLAKEDHYFSAGKSNTIVTYKGWKIALQVCYDLRFPALVNNQLDEQGVPTFDLIIYVANWPQKRSLHWKTLLQARAIENQCFVVAVNRVGSDANDLDYSGDSSVFNALGDVLAYESGKEALLEVSLTKSSLNEIRSRLPFLKDK